MPAAKNQPIGRAFTDPVRDAQSCFRRILAAMAEPGTIHRLDADIEQPPGLAPAAALALLTLADFETPVWLGPGTGNAAAFLRFHAGARIVDAPGEAGFAVLDGCHAEPGLAAFNPGDDRYPDRSATVIVQCGALTGGPSVTLAGPGIRSSRIAAPSGLWPGFWDEAVLNAGRYPLGLDLMLVADHEIMALPRSCQIMADHADPGKHLMPELT